MMKRLADLIQKEADSIEDGESPQGAATSDFESVASEETTAEVVTESSREADDASPTIGGLDKAN